MKIEVGNRIDFTNAILKDENNIKVEPRFYYSLSRCKNKVSCDILTYMSEHVTLVHLMDSLVNFNRDTSVVGYWIFNSNYKKSLVLNRE